MTNNSRRIKVFRQRFPAFECVPGCHDCCGPVTAASDEVAHLPVINESEYAAAPANLASPYLGDLGWEVYPARPLICRVVGTTPQLSCPNGRRPAALFDPRVEQQIFRFFANTRKLPL